MQSTTIQFYYKGFSILLTKRDETVSMKGLLTEAMLDIDWAIAHNVQPSWNKATNDEVAEQEYERIRMLPPTPVTQTPNKTGTPMPVEQFDQTCPDCGAKKILSKKGNMVCSKFCWTK